MEEFIKIGLGKGRNTVIKLKFSLSLTLLKVELKADMSVLVKPEKTLYFLINGNVML